LRNTSKFPQVNALVAVWELAVVKGAVPLATTALAPDGVWLQLLACGNPGAAEKMESFFAHFPLDALVAAVDPHGRKALDVATPQCKATLVSKLYLGGLYELDLTQLVHQSTTCKVYMALDHGGEAGPVCVVLKCMKRKDQWQRELDARVGGADGLGKLDGAFVIDVLRVHSSDMDERFKLDLEARGLGDYPFCLVMPRADRSLADVLKHEHLAPSPAEVQWSVVRDITAQVAAALHHLHAHKTTHGDLKPLNIMRTGSTWRLIDLDAATRFGEHAGAKSSAAFCAPELVFAGTDEAQIKTPLPAGSRGGDIVLPYAPVAASSEQDVW
jgi:serine/threonine protein kinase